MKILWSDLTRVYLGRIHDKFSSETEIGKWARADTTTRLRWGHEAHNNMGTMCRFIVILIGMERHGLQGSGENDIPLWIEV